MKTLNQPKKNGAMKRRAVAALCAVVMLAVCVPMIGGTLAYLMDKTPELVNKFELGELNYVLQFDKNKPDNASADVEGMPAEKTATVAAPSCTFDVTEKPTLTGYEFLGWSKAMDSNVKYLLGNSDPISIPVEYDEDDQYVVENATTTKVVNAIWEPNTYTVVYNNNVNPDDDTVTQPNGSTEASIHTYDKEQTLSENGFTRTGYTFIGWNTQPDGRGTAYVNKQSVVNLTAEDGATVTLYAQWGVKSYAIRYHANGGEGNMPDQVIEWDKLTKISENKFTNTTGDYKFAGWSTTPTGEVEYLENQQVVNLLESGTLDLYAVWLLNSYTVTFDYNIGYGTPPTKEVLYGEEYGVLPPYLTTETENLFKGWYTAKEGGERVYPGTIVNRKEDHTLWAHWDPSPANDVIKGLVVHNSADDNNDGVVDEMHLEFVCSSSFEKYNVPLHNLVPGQKYKLTYTTSNNASFGDYIKGYQSARYGSYIVKEATEDSGNLGTNLPNDIIATWYDRIEPDGSNDGSHAATNDAWLNGPWANRTIEFVATASTMYWAWEFGLIEDGIRYDYNIYDIRLEPIVPEIEFANKKVVKVNTSSAKIESQSNGTYKTTFTFNGDSGCETLYWPITGLTTGTTYTITFDHHFTGPLIHDTKTHSNPTYEYGCGIMGVAPTAMGDKMSNLGTWTSTNVFVKETVDNAIDKVTLTFTATSDTMYWVWNMANCSDTQNTTTTVTVTNFSAKHSTGGNITYYAATSKATAMALMLVPEELVPVALTYDISIDELYPYSDMQPYAGMDYTMTFTPAEGYAMPEYIRVTIDGKEYQYITSQLSKGVDYDGLECYVLTISSELLANASTLHIEAIAETVGATYVVDLPNVMVSGAENTASAGMDGVLVLSGDNLPNIITVTMKDDVALDGTVRQKGITYMTSLDETLLHASIMAWEATPKADWLTENEDGSVTLTIPAGHMKDGEVITISGMYYETTPLTEFTLDDLL